MGPGVPLPKDLSEFCDSKYWDAFFKARGGRPFEWYGDWELISKLVMMQCGLKKNAEERILIPGCGNSSLSADMYDAGFPHITNIDFSRVVISEMLRKHVRSRPLMRWLVMDMTKMQLPDSSFDVVLDKGGLDALLGEPDDEKLCGIAFLSEVKRVLKPNGRFACITLAQQHVMELLLSSFREGWLVGVHGLQLSAADSPSSLQPFIVIAKHENKPNLPLVSFDLDLGWRGASNKLQMQAVVETLDAENALRNQGLTDSRIDEGPEVNPQDSYEALHPGRRLTTKLGGQRSQFTYAAVILDARDDIKPEYRCAVFLVPKGRAHEWLFSSKEGQWQVAESTKAGRLIMVILEPNQYVDNILNLKDDLSPLVECLLPLDCRESGNVPYMTQGDGIASRNILDEVDSPMTGAMLVEDVVLSNERTTSDKPAGGKSECFRRLVFRRNPNLIQSEALLIRQNACKSEDKAKTVGKHGASKRKKKASKEVLSTAKLGIAEELKVDHSYLASPYHEGMVAAFVLVVNNLERWLASKQQIRLMLVGLGAGLLPMFLHNHLPIDDIQIVELDPVVGDVAKRHFGFIEDERMRLQFGDGIAAVQAISDRAASSRVQSCQQEYSQGSRQMSSRRDHVPLSSESGMIGNLTSTNQWAGNAEPEPSTTVQDSLKASDDYREGSIDFTSKLAEDLHALEVRDGDKKTLSGGISPDYGLHVLIIDADSEDPSSGLSCPPPEFLEDRFLLAARGALLDGGILIVNVVSRATAHHVQYVTQMKKFFEEVYDIEVNEDVNRVLIALPQPRNGGEPSDIMDDLSKLEKIVAAFASWGNGPDLKETVRDLKRLK